MEPAQHSPSDPPGGEDALRRLQERLERASEAAERLFADAAGRVKPPPAGWQMPPDDAAEHPGGELELLLSMLEGVRELVPPDLRRRLADAVREVLLAVRALIDWHLERLERGRTEPVEVQDIPVL